MCGRYSVGAYAAELAEAFGARVVDGWSPAFNVAPTRSAPVVRVNGGRELVALRWGLVPAGLASLAAARRYATFNARSETAAGSRAFAEAFRSRRCLVPATSWFEWRRVGARKWPYAIRVDGGGPMAFAGVWERWERDGEAVSSFAILTVPASAAVRVLHDRMPAVLPREAWAAWLDPRVGAGEAGALLRPLDGPALDAFPVSPEVGRATAEGAHLVEPLA